MNNRTKWTTLVVLVCGVVLGLVISSKLNLTPSVISSIDESSSVPLVTTDDLTEAVMQVANTVGPAVVSIHTERVQKYQTRRQFFGSPFQDDFFDRFFEDFFGDMPERELKRQGLGSGVIIDHRGYILTNEHVISEADSINVTLPDGREFEAELKGTDPRSDLAVIKIEDSSLPAARLGNSDTLKIGQWVVAIGNPFGQILQNPEPTVTAGVVSALRRSLPRTSRRDTNYTNLIQTDAAINPGNSGGPLVNLKGEIVGINVAIFSTSGGYQGVGFAIPVSTAKRIIDRLIAGKEIEYGWLGVSIQNLDQRLADYFGLENTYGVLIAKVMDDGPAKKAGMKDDDIILEVDGKKMKDTTALLDEIGSTPVGEKITLTVFRDGRTRKVLVVAGKRPYFDDEGEIIKQEKGRQPETEEDSSEWRGVEVKNLTPQLAKRLRLKEAGGVVAISIEDDSPAEDAGLRKGDIVTKINKQSVKNVSEFIAATKMVKGDCLIRTIRGYFVVKK